ncbi:MAG: hypothetical protein LKI80_10450 [Sporolactobacillus sp.]|nr:hypothetical protein [Sporolactobacillus sp.]
MESYFMVFQALLLCAALSSEKRRVKRLIGFAHLFRVSLAGEIGLFGDSLPFFPGISSGYYFLGIIGRRASIKRSKVDYQFCIKRAEGQ